MSSNYLFILNNFNDVDQTMPLLVRLLDHGDHIMVLCLSDYELSDDERINYLKRYSEFRILEVVVLKYFRYRSSVLARIAKRLIFNHVVALAILRKNRIGACIYGWCDPRYKGFQTRIFASARILGIPNLCIPHGQNIFLNWDVNTHLVAYHAKTGCWPDFSPRNKYDSYIVQSEHHREQKIAWGMEPNKVFTLGSMRFSPAWIQRHVEICSPYDGFPNKVLAAIRIVFFVPHWHYNVDIKSTVDLIEQIGKEEETLLAVKAHTRGDGLSPEVVDGLRSNNNIDLDAKAPSSSLIEWSDIVINFGSSIGLEAIVKGKVVINPVFLHRNKTVFDQSGVVYDAYTPDNVISIIKNAKKDSLPDLPASALDSFMLSEIFAGEKQVEPVLRYEQALKRLSSD
jgi:hypothetical protein